MNDITDSPVVDEETPRLWPFLVGAGILLALLAVVWVDYSSHKGQAMIIRHCSTDVEELSIETYEQNCGLHPDKWGDLIAANCPKYIEPLILTLSDYVTHCSPNQPAMETGQRLLGPTNGARDASPLPKEDVFDNNPALTNNLPAVASMDVCGKLKSLENHPSFTKEDCIEAYIFMSQEEQEWLIGLSRDWCVYVPEIQEAGTMCPPPPPTP